MINETFIDQLFEQLRFHAQTYISLCNRAFQCAYIECPAYVVDDLRARFNEYLAEQLALVDSAVKVGAKPTYAVGVSVLLTINGKLLLARRTSAFGSETGNVFWCTPGGRIEQTENIESAARREFTEETSGSLTGEIRNLGCREHFRFGKHYFMFYLHATGFEGQIRDTDADVKQHWEWVALDAIPQNCTEPRDILDELAAAPDSKVDAPCFTCEGEQGQPATRKVQICEACYGDEADSKVDGMEPLSVDDLKRCLHVDSLDHGIHWEVTVKRLNALLNKRASTRAIHVPAGGGRVSQLEEALRELNSLQHQMAIELDPIPAQPRVEYWTRRMEDVICKALAGSEPAGERPSAARVDGA